MRVTHGPKGERRESRVIQSAFVSRLRRDPLFLLGSRFRGNDEAVVDQDFMAFLRLGESFQRV